MSKPKLYVKEGCPKYGALMPLPILKTKSMELEIIDVRKDPFKNARTDRN